MVCVGALSTALGLWQNIHGYRFLARSHCTRTCVRGLGKGSAPSLFERARGFFVPAGKDKKRLLLTRMSEEAARLLGDGESPIFTATRGLGGILWPGLKGLDATARRCGQRLSCRSEYDV